MTACTLLLMAHMSRVSIKIDIKIKFVKFIIDLKKNKYFLTYPQNMP
jgi:hypothetical protein